MAGIDKCYLKKYSDYVELKEFLKDKSFVTPRGVTVKLSDILYPDIKEEAFFWDNGEPRIVPVFNSPTCVDNWLYHNCPLKSIQDWLRKAYPSEFNFEKGELNELTNELKLPEYEPSTDIKIIKKGLGNVPRKFWWVEISMLNKDVSCYNDSYYSSLHYNENYDFWVLPNEHDIWTCSCPTFKITVKSIIRKILKKWKLPKNCKIVISGNYDEWILKTK